MRHFNIGMQDVISCEACGKQGRIDGGGYDLHHIVYRSQGGTDEVENCILLCRRCHDKAHATKLNKDELQLIHNYTLTGMSKRNFIK